MVIQGKKATIREAMERGKQSETDRFGVTNQAGCLTGFRFWCSSHATLIVSFNRHKKGAVREELAGGEAAVSLELQGCGVSGDTGSQQDQICA